MRIIVTAFSIAPRTGGLRVGVLGLCKGLANRGHKVSLYTTNADEDKTLNVPLGVSTLVEGVEVFFYPAQKVLFGNVLSYPMVSALKNAVPNADLVLIHSLYQLSSTAAAYYCRQFRVPYVVRPHGILDPTLARRRRWLLKWAYLQFFEKKNLNSAAAIQFSSSMEEEMAKDFMTIKSPKLLIPEGIDVEPFKKLPHKGSFRARYPEMEGKSLILHLGRVHQKKGLELLVEAFYQIAKRRDDVHLVLAGSGDADFVMRITKMLHDFGIFDRATITGQLDEDTKLAVLQDADIFVLASYGENFGLSVVEAMACGLPVLISDKVGIWKEIVGAGAGIVTTCESNKIADQIEKLLNDPELRLNTGQRGKSLVEAQFSTDRMAEKMESAYYSLCGIV
jgi:glycosyltransferase involved in cell wall biosynthesis